MEQELSLHYTLTQTFDSPEIDNNENSNSTVDSGDTPNDEIQTDHGKEVIEDHYFDPFAVEDNNKKFGEITINKLSQTQEIDDDDDELNEDDELKEDDGDDDELNEDDEDDDIKDEDDEALRKEMESNWNKEEKEKNKNIISVFESIRNKHKKPTRKNIKKYPSPSIKPFVFDGNLKITFNKSNQILDKDRLQQIQHYHPINQLKTRKKMKNELKKQLNKKRKKEMKQYRKEFGKEEHYFKETKAMIPKETHKENKSKITEKVFDQESEEIWQNEDSDIEEIDAEKYIEDIVFNGDELDEEDLARAALMTKQEVISSEVRQLLDIAADEEDENGVIIGDTYEDEHEENFGIAKDLLAEKEDILLLKKHQDIYDAKRNEVHQMLLNRDDDKELELMKKAFVDGEYRALQNKAKNRNNYLGILDDATHDGESALKVTSRLNAQNEADYYLSDDEEKNECCCYDKNGRFYDVNTIRMKIMEWNRNKMDNVVQEDDEEDVEAIKQRKERVRRREIMKANNDNVIKNDKIGEDDKNAIRLLQKLRNKKVRKKANLNKASTLAMGTNFSSFYSEKGLKIPELQRSHSSSFLMHRDKCIEKVKIEESRSKGMSSKGSIGKKHVIFHQKSNNKKRKRDDNHNNNNSNVYKKRRIK